MLRKSTLMAVAATTLLVGLVQAPALQAACTTDTHHLCLQGNRFEVSADFLTAQGATGPVNLVRISADTGYAYFTNPNNVELIVKVLKACNGSAPRFWVFAGGLTNVRIDMTVVDTNNGQERTYTNPQSTPFEPIQDTGAFATCP